MTGSYWLICGRILHAVSYTHLDVYKRQALVLFDGILVGGAALSRQAREAASKLGLKVVTTYGSSETSGGCVYDGKPIPGAQVRIREGRIELGGPMIAQGYRNSPAHEDFAESGWFKTSDAGEFVDSTLVVKVALMQ